MKQSWTKYLVEGPFSKVNSNDVLLKQFQCYPLYPQNNFGNKARQLSFEKTITTFKLFFMLSSRMRRYTDTRDGLRQSRLPMTHTYGVALLVQFCL